MSDKTVLNEAIEKARKVEDSLEDGIRLSNQDLYLVSMLNEIESLEADNKVLTAKVEKLEGHLIHLREFISKFSVNIFGSNSDGEKEWSLRDEIIDGITQILTTNRGEE